MAIGLLFKLVFNVVRPFRESQHASLDHRPIRLSSLVMQHAIVLAQVPQPTVLSLFKREQLCD